ncbi:hypothetical protein LZ318_17095 [Saccharopolyspora indica]|uniref:WXG100-like domain-containing protein n=1 Tax=Saccharopolyspora indica TaxID=1229659 RepID=UPI0022EB1B5E|nr:hypothetical protein [Saccharopolyspora indica]MDA3648602.1 hypothetical protein [Saccharopolyspora indica]
MGDGVLDEFSRQVMAFGEWADGYIDELNEFRSSWGFPVLPIPRLSSVFRLLIGEYPEADENKSAELGEAWSQEAERAVEFLREAQLALDAVNGSWNGGLAASSMGMAFTELAQAVNDYATTATSYAKGAYDFNMSVVLAKNIFQGSLLLLCYELIRAAVAAVFTMGGSFLTVPPAIVAARNGTRIAVTQALQRVGSIFIQQTLRRLGLRSGTVATRLGARTFAGAAARTAPPRVGGLLANTVARQQSRHLLREVVALAAARGATPALRREAVRSVLRNPAVRQAIRQQVAARLAGRSVPFAAAVTREQAALISTVVRRAAERGVMTRRGVLAFTTRNLLQQRVIGYGLQSALKFGVGTNLYAQFMTVIETDGRYEIDLRSTAAAFVGASLGGAPLGLASRLPGFVALGAVGGAAGYAGATAVTHAEKVWETATDPGKLWDAVTDVDELWKNDRIRQEIADAAIGGAIGGSWERYIGERSWHEAGQGMAVRNVIATGQAPDLGNVPGGGVAPAIAQLGQDPVAGATPEAGPAGTAAGGTAAGAAAQSGAGAGGAGQGGASGSGGSNTGHGGGARTGGGAAGSGGSGGGSGNGRAGAAAPGDDGGNGEGNEQGPESGKPEAGTPEQSEQARTGEPERTDPTRTGDQEAERVRAEEQEAGRNRTGEQETERGRTGDQQTERGRTGEQETEQTGDREAERSRDQEGQQSGDREAERAATDPGQADPGRAASENGSGNQEAGRAEPATRSPGAPEADDNSAGQAENENRTGAPEPAAGQADPSSTETGDGSSQREPTGTPDAERSEAPGPRTAPDESGRPDGLRELGSVARAEPLRLEPPSPPEDPVRMPDLARAGVSDHLVDLVRQGLGSLDVDTGTFTAQASTGEVVQVRLGLQDDLPPGEFQVLPGEFELTPAGHVQTAPAEIRISTATTQYPEAAGELGGHQTAAALSHLLATTPVIASGEFTAAHGRTPLPAGQADVRAFGQPPPRTARTEPGAPGTIRESEQLLHEEIARRQTETTLTIADSDPIAIAGTPGQTLLVHYAQAGTDVAVDLTVDPTLASGEVQARAPGWRNDGTSTLRQTGPGEVRVSTAGTPEQMRSMIEAGLRALHQDVPVRDHNARDDAPSDVALAHSAVVDETLPGMAEAALWLADQGVRGLTQDELNQRLLAVFPGLFNANGQQLEFRGALFSVGLTFGDAAHVATDAVLGRRQTALVGLPEQSSSASRGTSTSVSGKAPLSLATGGTVSATPQTTWSTSGSQGTTTAQQAHVSPTDQLRGEFLRYDLTGVKLWIRAEAGATTEVTADRAMSIWVNAAHQQPAGDTVVFEGARRDEDELVRASRLLDLDDTAQVVDAVLAQLPAGMRENDFVRAQVVDQVQRRAEAALRPDGLRFDVAAKPGGKAHRVTLRTRVRWDTAEPAHAAAAELGHGRVVAAYHSATGSTSLTRTSQSGSSVGPKVLAAYNYLRGRGVSVGSDTSTGHFMLLDDHDFRPKHTYRVQVTTEVEVGQRAESVTGRGFAQLSVQDAASNGLPVGRRELQYTEDGEIATTTVQELVLDGQGNALTAPREVPLVARSGYTAPGAPSRNQLQDSGPTLLDRVVRMTGLPAVRDFLHTALTAGKFTGVDAVLAQLTEEDAQAWIGEAMQDGFLIRVEPRNGEPRWVKVEARWEPERAEEISRIDRTQRVSSLLTSTSHSSTVELTRSRGHGATGLLGSGLGANASTSRSASIAFSQSENVGTRLEYRGGNSVWRLPVALAVSVVDATGAPVLDAAGAPVRAEIADQVVEISVPTAVAVAGRTVPVVDPAQFAELVTSMHSLLHLDARGLDAAVRSAMPVTGAYVDTTNASALAHIGEWLSHGELVRPRAPDGDVRGRAEITARPTGLRVLNRLTKVAAGPMALSQAGHSSSADRSRSGSGSSDSSGEMAEADLVGASQDRTTGTTANQKRAGGSDENVITPYHDGLTFEADLDIAVRAGEAAGEQAPTTPPAVVPGKFQFVLSAQQVVEFYANGNELVVDAVPAATIDEMLTAWADDALPLDRRVAARAVLRRAAETGEINRRLVDRALREYPSAMTRMLGRTNEEASTELTRLLADTDEELVLNYRFRPPGYQPGSGLGPGVVSGWQADVLPLWQAKELLAQLDVADTAGLEERLRSALAPGEALNHTQGKALASGGTDLFSGLIRRNGRWMRLTVTYQVTPDGQATATGTEPGATSSMGHRHRAGDSTTSSTTSTRSKSQNLTADHGVGESDVGGTGSTSHGLSRTSRTTTSHAEVSEPGVVDSSGLVRFERPAQAWFTAKLETAPLGPIGVVRALLPGEPPVDSPKSTGTLSFKHAMHRARPEVHGPREAADHRRLTRLPDNVTSRIVEWSMRDLLPSAEAAVRKVLRAAWQRPQQLPAANNLTHAIQRDFTAQRGKALWHGLSSGLPALVGTYPASPLHNVAVDVRLQNFEMQVVRRYERGEHGTYGLDRAQRTTSQSRGRSRTDSAGAVGDLPGDVIDGEVPLAPGVKRSTTTSGSAAEQSGAWAQSEAEDVNPRALVRLRARFTVTATMNEQTDPALPVAQRHVGVDADPVDIYVEVPAEQLDALQNALRNEKAWQLTQDAQLPEGKLKGVLRALARRDQAAEEQAVDLNAAMRAAEQRSDHDPQHPHRSLAAHVREEHAELTSPGSKLHLTDDATAAQLAHDQRTTERMHAFLDEIAQSAPTVDVQPLRTVVTELERAAAAVATERAAVQQDPAARNRFENAMQNWRNARQDLRAMLVQHEATGAERTWMARFDPGAPTRAGQLAAILETAAQLTGRRWTPPAELDRAPLDPVELARGLAAELSFAETAAVEIELSVIGGDGTTTRVRITGDGEVHPITEPPPPPGPPPAPRWPETPPRPSVPPQPEEPEEEPDETEERLAELGIARHPDDSTAWAVRLPDGRKAVLRVVGGQLLAARSPDASISVPLSRVPRGRRELDVLVGMALRKADDA